MGTFWQDVRYGLRTLVKRPGFTLAALVSLALGIGANSTIFSWVNAVLLNPFPAAAEPNELVVFKAHDKEFPGISLSYPDYVDLRDENTTLDGFLVTDLVAMSLDDEGEASRVWGEIVSGNYFDVLGVKMHLGRGFLPEEDRTPLTHPVAVFSYGLWRDRFGGDPSIVSTTVTLNNRPCTVVGIAPIDFQGTQVALTLDAWVPMMMQEVFEPGGDRLEKRGDRWLDGMARLKPYVSRKQAEAELSTIAARLAEEYPETNNWSHVSLHPLVWSPAGATRALRPVLLTLMAVVGVVLLIACANVANLLLVRAAGRRREIAIRLSLGAGRTRLVRQLLTESLILALAGGTLGICVALWTSDLFMAFAPPTEFPVGMEIDVDGRVLAFTLALSVLTGLIFGLVPALTASRPDLVTSLKQEGSAMAATPSRGRLRNSLVVTQIAMCLVLLVAAGLLIRSLDLARSADPGFNPRSILLASVDLFPNGYEPPEGRQLFTRVLDQVAALPGVESVSLARKVPLGFGGESSTSLTVEGYEPAADEMPWTYYDMVGPDYFRTMQIPLVGGRGFTRQDVRDAPTVAVISQALANRYWPGQDPIGKRIRLGDWVTIVGVAHDIKHQYLNESPRPFLFLPILQFYQSDATIIVRTGGDPAALATAVTHEVHQLDATLPVFGVHTLAKHIAASSAQQHMAGVLLGIFGVLALLLASIGLYGVLAYAASQRTHEIGVRMALGAQRWDAMKLILGQGMILAAIGVAFGLAVSLAVTRLLASLLYGVSATDPLILGGVAVVLTLVSLTACYVPARRASQIDPMAALRCE